jgi:predicted DNA-binding transcriptional regulator AlpA
MPPPLPPPPKPLRLIDGHEVTRRTTEAESTRDAKEARGEHPLRVPVGPRRVAWVEAEIDAYVATKIQARDDLARRQAAYAERNPAPNIRRRERRSGKGQETTTAVLP